MKQATGEFEFPSKEVSELLAQMSSSQLLLDVAVEVFFSEDEARMRDHLNKHSKGPHVLGPDSPFYKGPSEDELPFRLYNLLKYGEERDGSIPGITTMAKQLQYTKFEAMHLNLVLRLLARSFFEYRSTTTQLITQVYPAALAELQSEMRDLQSAVQELQVENKQLRKKLIGVTTKKRES